MRPPCRRREGQRRVIALGFTEDAFILLDFAQLRTRRQLSQFTQRLAALLPHLLFELGSLFGPIPNMFSAGQTMIHYRLHLGAGSLVVVLAALGGDVGGCEGKQQRCGCRRPNKS